jgi:putative component of membrane protein insertase Oxa1/YidC/SpoIIIJ protein YidD
MQGMEEVPACRNEQDAARDYSLNHPLARPATNVVAALKCLVLLEMLVIVMALALGFLLGRLGISFPFYTLHSSAGVIILCTHLKRICILLIELYQHYATEPMRRRCTLMPSCSEYALLAIEKYNVVKALYKTYVRLTRRCKGGYLIDYP